MGITFAFNGFTGLSDVYIVQGNSQVWSYDGPNNYSITLTGDPFADVAGRFLYPTPVQMMDPLTTTANNFSTTFIFQILASSEFGLPDNTGPGLAFIIVRDNTTIGAIDDYMGLLTANTTETTENYNSDSHTVGVELDTYQNQEFNDPNNNHICIDVASMNSTSTNTFIPSMLLATSNADLYQQVWIDYFQANSEMIIYHAQYPSSKPAIPVGSMVGVDLSLLNEYMYVGFSSSSEVATNNQPTIMAWSFSNEGEAPPIKIGKDAGPPTPSSPPPPPTPSSRSPPPNTSSPRGPVPAPTNPPSPSTSPPNIVPPPAPVVSSPPPPILSPPPPVQSNPPSSPSPSVPPPLSRPSPGPSSPPPVSSPTPGPSSPLRAGSGSPIKVIEGAVSAVVGAFLLLASIYFIICPCWKSSQSPKGNSQTDPHSVRIDQAYQNVDVDGPSIPTGPAPIARTAPVGPKLRIFICHAGGSKSDGSLKIFPTHLYNDLRRDPCYIVFMDSGMKMGVDFTKEIKEELWKADLGIVILSDEFFHSRWCMLELKELVELHNKKRVQVLPVFYTITPDQVRDFLRDQRWEDDWRRMSTASHPINVGDYREAVNTLCNIHGMRYPYNSRNSEPRYGEDVLAKVKEIYYEKYPDVRLANGN